MTNHLNLDLENVQLVGSVIMKIVSIIGTRPNFTKMAPLIDVIDKKGHEQIVVHTGQHYDKSMSDVFLDELNICCSENLNIGSGTHGYQTAMMLMEIEKILISEKVDVVLVPGDTNSALAGALAASKLHIPIAHIESGLRSFDKRMPEEINRILIDHCSDFLFCPTEISIKNLLNEGIDENKMFLVGDTMVESCSYFLNIAQKQSDITEKYDIQDDYFLATVHRAENTDNKDKLSAIIEALLSEKSQIVFPLHPRTKFKLEEFGLLDTVIASDNILLIEPVGYIDFLMLASNAKLILTDSGGVQKEAFLLQTPCITLRENTEWVETIDSGWNILVGSDKNKIVEAISSMQNHNLNNCENPFGDGNASEKIIETLERYYE